MDLWRIAVRVLVAYIYLLVMTRASGKRIVRQATPFDLIVSLIVGDLIDDALWAEVSVAKFGAAVGSIFFCDALTKLAAWRWKPVYGLLNGLPSALLRDGSPDGDALRHEQLSEEDLAHLLRLQGIDDWNDVHLALAERDHELSVLLTPGAEPATREDAKRVQEMVR
jgi:uncharacterized membrane protein YcaP (DUF421 family)